MDKNANLTVGSPCEFCGLPSVTLIHGNVPVCARHLQQSRSAAPAQKLGSPAPSGPLGQDWERIRDARGTMIDEVADKLRSAQE